MKLSVTNLSWNFDEDKALSIMKNNNFDFIELSLTKKFNTWDNIKQQTLKDYKNYLYENYGIQISSLQSLFYGMDINLFANTKEFEQHFKRILNFANILDCKYVVFGSPNNRRLNGTDVNKAKEIFLESFSNISSYDSQIKIGIETNPFYYKNDFITSYEQCIELTKTLNKENVVFHFDLGCIVLNNDDYLKIYENEKNNLNLIHLSCKDLKDVYSNKDVENFLNVVEKEKHIISIEMLNQTCYDFEKSLQFVVNRLNK